MRDIKDLLIENGLSGVFYEEGDAIFFLEDGSFKAGLIVLVDDKLSQIVMTEGFLKRRRKRFQFLLLRKTLKYCLIKNISSLMSL